jgi:predicted small metal-binding protein
MNTVISKPPSAAPVLDAIDGIEPLIKKIKTSKNKIDELEAAMAAEKEQLRDLVSHFMTVEKEIRGIAGIVDDHKPKRRSKAKRKPTGTTRDPIASIAGGASRVIGKANADGKDRAEAKREAIEKASACAKKKHGMSKLSPEVLDRIDAALNKIYGVAA